MPRSPQIHNLGHNTSERVPPRCLFFDTETLPTIDGDGERHHLQLWVAELVERHGPSQKRPRATAWSGTTAAQLADAVEDACRYGETLWIWAHNLGFDLAVTMLPIVLAERGWDLTQHALTGSSPWLRMRKTRRGITMVDSYSWLPVPLAQLGYGLGREKPPLPAWEGSREDWLTRCTEDVRILRDAVLSLLDYHERHGLGHWSLTGPGTGFNVYRHRFLRTKIVIDPNPELRGLERAVIYGGRSEVWRVGPQPAGLYALVDFRRAFGTICAELPLPRRTGRRFTSLPLTSLAVDDHWLGLLAQVEIETGTPRYPLRTTAGVVHPVGRFVTTLCGPEIAEAARRDDLRAIGPGLFYWTTPHMREWARWCLSVIDDDDGDTPAPVRVAAKAWTRTVPGRWAGRTGRVAFEVEQPIPGWRLERTHSHPNAVPTAILDMAGRRYYIAQDEEMENTRPAILAWIQSYVRVLIGRLIDRIGEPSVVLAHTDGVVIDVDKFCAIHEPWTNRLAGPQGKLEVVGARLDGWAKACHPLRPVVKWVSRTLEVLSPQHIVTDHSRQLAGVPRSAAHHGDHVYSFTDWPRLATQLQSEVELGYVRRRRTVDLGHIPVLRWVLDDGRTAPVAAAGALSEGSRLLGAVEGGTVPSGASVRPTQHPLLAGLR